MVVTAEGLVLEEMLCAQSACDSVDGGGCLGFFLKTLLSVLCPMFRQVTPRSLGRRQRLFLSLEIENSMCLLFMLP